MLIFSAKLGPLMTIASCDLKEREKIVMYQSCSQSWSFKSHRLHSCLKEGESVTVSSWEVINWRGMLLASSLCPV